MLRKILLTLSVLAFTIGSCHFEASQWGVGLPLGAVFLILFMIVTLLEKETALYDAEQQHKTEEQATSSPATGVAGSHGEGFFAAR